MNIPCDIKLVVVDLDDTLLDSKGKISKATRIVMRQVSSKGIIVILATGRMTPCVEPFVDDLGIDCPVVVYNGAMVRDMRSAGRKILFHKTLESRFSDIVINYCIKNNLCLNFYLDDVVYSQKNPDLEKFQRLYSKRTGARYVLVDDLKVFSGKRPTKLIIITDIQHRDVFRTRDYQFEYFSQLFDGQVQLFRTDPEYLEIQHRNTDKGIGVHIYAEKCKIKRNQIIAFGNGENDIAMLKYAGIGVAVKNASEIVKKHADIIAQWSNNEDCVARILKQYIL